MSASVPEIQPHWSLEDSITRVEQAGSGGGSRVKVLSDGSLMMTCVNPAHDDHTPSLHATWRATEHGGRTLLHCPACGPHIEQREWAEMLGLTYDDLFDDQRWSLHHRSDSSRARRSPAQRTAGKRHSKAGPLPALIAHRLPELLEQVPDDVPVVVEEHEHALQEQACYEYRDASNTVVQKVIRFRCAPCGEKTFRQSYRGPGGRWVNSQPDGFTPVLYRHPQVVEAVADGTTVWIVEGEKDADTAVGLGLVGTTNARGGAHFPAELVEVFAGARVVVVLDRDATGWARGVHLHQALMGAGAEQVRLMLPAVTDLKADLTDHIEAGFAVEELLEVPLAAVTAWSMLRELQRHTKRIEQAETEISAQLQVARFDGRHGRKSLAADRRRHAKRWAAETVTVLARARETAQGIAAQAVSVPQCSWAGEAVEIAQSYLVGARAVALSVHDTTGMTPAAEVSAPVDVAAAPALEEPDVDEPLVLDPTITNSLPAGQPHAVGANSSTAFELITGGGGGGGGSRTWDPKVRIKHTEYQVYNGEIVEVRHVPVGRGESEEWETTYTRVINADITIARKECVEVDDDLDRDTFDLDSLGDRDGREGLERVRSLPTVSHVVYAYEDSDHTRQLVRVKADDSENGAWLSSLPIPGLDFSRARAGRDKVATAINQISRDWSMVTSYRATGWRRLPDERWVYITAEGAIGKDGFEAIATNLTGPLARFNWPNPSTDQQQIRRAFLRDSAGMMGSFPDRVGAVLLGTAYRAVVCPNEWVTLLTASPGVGKTGVAALTMHHFGEMWDRHKPMTSMSGNGATFNALRQLANTAKDALMFMDDVAPTMGTEVAQKRCEEGIRLISNQESRPRAERDGQGVLPGTRPRTSGLITAELPPRAGTSGERRALIVPLNRIDIDVDAIRALDAMDSRHGRALLMSSFLRWMATDRMQVLDRAAALRDQYRAKIMNTPGHPAAWERHVDKIAELWAGWGLMLDFLGEAGALEQHEVTQWADRVDEALTMAAEYCEDPDLVGSTGQRCVELLRHALSTGTAYASDIHTGDAPVGLESRLGWRAVKTGDLPSSREWRADPRAMMIGYVNLDPMNTSVDRELVCTRAALEATLKATAATMVDTSTIDLGTVLRALEDEGVLKVQMEKRRGGMIPRRTLPRTIFCQRSVTDLEQPIREKRVVLLLDVLLGESDDGGGMLPWNDDDDPTGNGDTTPQTPPSADNPIKTDVENAEPAPGALFGEAAAPQEEPTMAGPTMTDYTNAGGLTLYGASIDQVQACARCGTRAAMSFVGVPLHIGCYLSTTATTREQLQKDLASAVAAAVQPAKAPLPDTASPAEPTTTATPAVITTEAEAAKAGGNPFRASVAVVGTDAAWLPDGTRIELTAPLNHLGDLEQLGRDLKLGTPPMKWHKHPEAGLVIPTPALWEQLGVHLGDLPSLPSKRRAWMEKISEQLPAIHQAVQSGWVFGRGDRAPQLRGLTRLRREGADYGQVAVLFTPGMPAEWGLDPALDPATIAARVELFTSAVGIPFRGSPISTGLDLLQIVLPRTTREALHPDNAVDYSQIPPAGAADLEAQFDWTRAPLEQEKDAPWLALYDRGGSYLATWSSLKLGIGAPEHSESPSFDSKCAGWWQVQLPARAEGDGAPYPDLLDPQGRRSGEPVWVTTPVLQYAIKDLDRDVQVLQAWTWPPERSKTVLSPLYMVLRDALAQLRAVGSEDAAAAAGLVKQIYKMLSGHFISEASDTRDGSRASGSSVDAHQPYWYHAMRGQARVSILHQILKTGREQGVWPLVTSNNDLLGYPVHDADLVMAWPGDPGKLGEGLGQYKATRWAPMEDQLPYLTGRGWGGLRATTTVREGLPSDREGA